MKNLLFSLSLGIILSFFGCTPTGKMELKVDHIMLAINDLDRGVAQFETMTGVQPIYGGVHPSGNTQNAIVPLGDKIYIEILAPKADLDSIPDFFKDFQELTPIGFAVAASNMAGLDQTIQELQFHSDGIQDGSRTTPDGTQLTWQVMLVNEPPLSTYPFFIHWSEDTKHPATDGEVQCVLTSLELITPYEAELRQILEGSQSAIPLLELEQGSIQRLRVDVNSPKGQRSF
ncbi:MAG: VOC family protein [Saprospiraceae bacterium]|nr:VOC family protein [Lewinella sp.]